MPSHAVSKRNCEFGFANGTLTIAMPGDHHMEYPMSLVKLLCTLIANAGGVGDFTYMIGHEWGRGREGLWVVRPCPHQHKVEIRFQLQGIGRTGGLSIPANFDVGEWYERLCRANRQWCDPVDPYADPELAKEYEEIGPSGRKALHEMVSTHLLAFYDIGKRNKRQSVSFLEYKEGWHHIFGDEMSSSQANRLVHTTFDFMRKMRYIGATGERGRRYWLTPLGMKMISPQRDTFDDYMTTALERMSELPPNSNILEVMEHHELKEALAMREQLANEIREMQAHAKELRHTDYQLVNQYRQLQALRDAIDRNQQKRQRLAAVVDMAILAEKSHRLSEYEKKIYRIRRRGREVYSRHKQPA